MKQTPGQLLLRFRPLPAQRRFLLAREHFAAYVGGFGSGKTYALCHKAIQLSGHNPGLPGMLVAPTYGMLEDVVMRSFTDILRLNRIDYKLHRTRRVLETAWGGRSGSARPTIPTRCAAPPCRGWASTSWPTSTAPPGRC